MSDENPRKAESTDLTGKTALVTGGNKGLGYVVARQLLLLRVSRLIITTQDEAKGQAAIAALRADPEVIKISDASKDSSKVEWFELNLEDYYAGVSFVRKVQRDLRELDILIFSAGLRQFEFERAKSGHEMMMQVNCYTNFLIILNLISLLRVTARKRGSPSRVTFVGSYGHMSHTLKDHPIPGNKNIIKYFDSEENFRRYHRYHDSKLMVNGFVQQLATVVHPSEIIVNSVCPGVVAADLSLNVPNWLKSYRWILQQIKGRTLQGGGRAIIRAATVVGKESHGKFVHEGRIDDGATFFTESIDRACMSEFWYEIRDEITLVYAKSLASKQVFPS